MDIGLVDFQTKNISSRHSIAIIFFKLEMNPRQKDISYAGTTTYILQ